MNLDQASIKVHSDCDATIASLRRQLAEARAQPVLLSDGRKGRLICSDVDADWPNLVLVREQEGQPEYSMPFDKNRTQGNFGLSFEIVTLSPPQSDKGEK